MINYPIIKLVISIHAPLTGSDRGCKFRARKWGNFNPRSPYGERPARGCVFLQDVNFNPRSPYGERPETRANAARGSRFQSTLPLRGATPKTPLYRPSPFISIHAPLTGSDLQTP